MRLLKNIIKTVLKKKGYVITRKGNTCENPFSILKYVVFELLERKQQCFLLQIGAHDGMRNDPVRPLINRYHLEGLLVEPMPEFFQELVKNYKSEPQLTFENCAIGPSNGEMSLFRFSRDAPVPKQFYHGLARFDRDYIVNRAKAIGLEEYVEEFKVPTLTFSDLIKKHNVKDINLLQIDTEGYDFEVLKMAFASDILPDIINYEWTELSPENRYNSRRLLLDKGYGFLTVGPDVLALLNS